MTQPQQYPSYPPAPPQQPGPYPQQPQAPYPPQPAYGQPQGYPQQGGYPQQAPPPAQPPAPLPRTTLADWTDQPSAGGGNLQFPALGHRHVLTVARPLGDADFPPQTNLNDGTVRRFSDGRIMVRMVVPAIVAPDAAHPDGHATLSVQGQMAEALKQAMGQAGAGHLNGVPEAGAVISVAYTSDRPAKRQGYNPQKIYEVTYQRPPGAAQADANIAGAAAAVTVGQPPAPIAQPPAPVGQAPQPVQPQGQPYQPQWPQQGAPLSAAPQPAPAGTNPYNNPQLPPNQPDVAGQIASAAQAGVQAAQAVPGQPQLTPENAALIAQLTGQQPPQ